ncbi:hypothetical protein [Streptomyces sp. NPDC021356]
MRPTGVEEAWAAHGPFFPGMEAVPASRVATGYVRSAQGVQTGQIHRVR